MFSKVFDAGNTLELLSKKHVKGLDFLILYHGNRGHLDEKPKNNQQRIRHTMKVHEIQGLVSY